MQSSKAHESSFKKRRLDSHGFYDIDDDIGNIQDADGPRTMNGNNDNSWEVSSDSISKRYGIGAKLLSKMGYVEGQGLGKNGSGIAVPISAEQRAMPNAGLGMLSSLEKVDEYSTVESSSDDEESISKLRNAISFKKTATEKLDDKMATNNQGDVERLIRQLQYICNLESHPELLSKIKKSIPSRIGELERLKNQIMDIQANVESIDHRIKILQPEISDLHEKDKVLNDIEKACKKELQGSSLHEIVDLILKLSDHDLVDALVSQLLRQKFPKNTYWDPLDSSNCILAQVLPLVEILQYQMDTTPGHLNRTQSVIFEIVFDKLLIHWKNFRLDKEQVDVVIKLLMDYESILEFVGSLEFIIKKLIYPKLEEALLRWNLDDPQEFPPRLWILDFIVIIDKDTREQMINIVEEKLYKYCIKWNHRRSKVIPEPDLLFIREILGEKYAPIINDIFLQKFVDQLWEGHFDPIIELRNWESLSLNEGSIYYMRRVKEYRLFFIEEDYECLIAAIFNELNKILFQWQLYCDTKDREKANWWFNWMINKAFGAVPLVNSEIKEIRRSLKFLNDPHKRPVHDESFDLQKQLRLKRNTFPDNSVSYTLENIPLRRVTPTFKDVLLDYCEEKGYIIQKLNEEHAKISHGGLKDALVPVFKIICGKNSHRVAVKDDILWTKANNGKYLPTYLYQIK